MVLLENPQSEQIEVIFHTVAKRFKLWAEAYCVAITESARSAEERPAKSTSKPARPDLSPVDNYSP